MRYILLIGDGMADHPVASLNHQTPLEYLALPEMAKLASGRLGMVQTVPVGVPPGSDTAILSILGCDPRTCYTGRAALEAAGANVPVGERETVWRVNLITIDGEDAASARLRSHNGMGIHGDAALETVHALRTDPEFSRLARSLDFVIHESPTFRQMGVAPSSAAWGTPLPGPHDHLGEPIWPLLSGGDIQRLVLASIGALAGRQANCIWPWAPGAAMKLPSFAARYMHHGAVISAVPLCKGIALLSGLDAPDIPGATGELDTNYEAKVEAALSCLARGDDFVAIHIEAPDECAHMKDVGGKLEALRRLDARVIAPLLHGLHQQGSPYRILFLSDHPTLVASGLHDGAPVPYCLYDSRHAAAAPHVFCETNAAKGEFLRDGTKLMDLLFSERC